MIEHSLFNTLFLPLLGLILWGGVLYGVALVIERFFPLVALWSRLWQIMVVVACAPLLPSFAYTHNMSFLNEALHATTGVENSVFSLPNYTLLTVGSDIELLSLYSVSILIFTMGSCYFIGQFGWSLIKVSQLARHAQPHNNLQSFDHHQQLKLDQYRVKVVVTEAAVSPFVYGLFKLYLVLPKHFYRLSEKRQFLLLEHELKHIERRDSQTVLLMRFVSSLCWFNPFIKYAETRFIQSMELDCDNHVVRQFPRDKLIYAETLLVCLKQSSHAFQATMVSHFADKKQQKSFFERRIRRAMCNTSNINRPRFIHWMISSFLCMCIPIVTVAKPMIPIQLVAFDKAAWMVPVTDARLASGFDEVNSFRGGKPHKGMDLAAPSGTPVRASHSGKVIIADSSSLHKNYGNVVVIEHSNNVKSLYAHLDSYAVTTGDYIIAGQVIGAVGTSGRVTGPHLHFEIMRNGERINPQRYLSREP